MRRSIGRLNRHLRRNGQVQFSAWSRNSPIPSCPECQWRQSWPTSCVRLTCITHVSLPTQRRSAGTFLSACRVGTTAVLTCRRRGGLAAQPLDRRLHALAVLRRRGGGRIPRHGGRAPVP